MKNKIIGFIFVFFVISYSSVFSVSIDLTVDSLKATLSDEVGISIAVDGERDAGEPNLKFPEAAFKLYSHGTSSQVQIINGKMDSKTIYNYSLLPLKEGEFVIGPAHAVIKGKQYKSSTYKLKIVKDVSGIASENTKDVFVNQEITSLSPFVGQQLLYTIKFYRAVKVYNSVIESSPDFSSFLSYDLESQADYYDYVDSKKYVVHEIKKILFPLKQGKIKLDPVVIRCEVPVEEKGSGRRSFDSFFSSSFAETKKKVLKSQELILDVKALPGFGSLSNDSAIVGDFSLTTSIDKNNVKASDSLTIKYVLSGLGNLENVDLPQFSEIENLKFYYDKPEIEKKISGDDIHFTKTFKIACVPVIQGEYVIPSLEIHVFNPNKKKYTLLKTKELKISVSPSDTPSPNPPIQEKIQASKNKVKILGKDILNINSSIHGANKNEFSLFIKIILFLLILFPPLLFLSIYFSQKKKMDFEKNYSKIRKSKALNKAKKMMHDIEKKVMKNERQKGFKQPYIELLNIIRLYIGDKFDLNGLALTSEEIKIKLKNAELEDSIIRPLFEKINECEMSQYASLEKGPNEFVTFIKETEVLLTKLDKSL
ncbi:MAG: BatD family protein [Pseudomonadota bacterium]